MKVEVQRKRDADIKVQSLLQDEWEEQQREDTFLLKSIRNPDRELGLAGEIKKYCSIPTPSKWFGYLKYCCNLN
jgi:hypothetical protein